MNSVQPQNQVHHGLDSVSEKCDSELIYEAIYIKDFIYVMFHQSDVPLFEILRNFENDVNFKAERIRIVVTFQRCGVFRMISI
jgi:hypothetical protein